MKSILLAASLLFTLTPVLASVDFDVDEDVEQWLVDNKVPALGVGIIAEGKIEKVKVYGELRRGHVAPKNTLFNVASLTKPITAVVALKLVGMGKWKLDEPLFNYWIDPDIIDDPRSKKITTRQILSHQTGLPNWRTKNKNNRLSFEFEPGDKYQYSGEGFEYLRRALESKFSTTFDQLANELIFRPLEMNDSRLIWTDSIDEDRYALNHDAEGNVYDTVKRTKANAADDLITTVEDYSKFLLSLMNGDILPPTAFDEVASPQIEAGENKYFGLGFVIYDLPGDEYALSHGGADNGVQTITFILPSRKQGLVIFTNVDDGYKLYNDLVTYYLGDAGAKILEIETGQ